MAISDLTTGMLGAVAVLAAVAGRDRSGSPAHGRGQRIDISLLESTLSWLANQAQNLFATGESPGRLGNAHPNIVPYETFATADGRDRDRRGQRAPVAAVRVRDRCAGADR